MRPWVVALLALSACDKPPPPCQGADCRPPIEGAAIVGSVDEAALRGKVVLVNYWATWCVPCLKEMPALEEVWRKRKGEGFVLLGALWSDEAGDEAVRQVMSARGVTYPTVRAGKSMVEPLGIGPKLPSSLLYGRDGKLVQRWLGTPVGEAELDEALTAALKK